MVLSVMLIREMERLVLCNGETVSVQISLVHIEMTAVHVPPAWKHVAPHVLVADVQVEAVVGQRQLLHLPVL